MNSKIPIFLLLFIMIFCLNCNETFLDANLPPVDQPKTPQLKAAAISVTYYVAKNGNDKNDGSSQAPFLTITRASQIANPGDVVIVRNGTYSSTSKNMNLLSCKGAEGNYITFQSESKHGAIMEGNNISSYCFSIVYGASYLKFIDFEIRNFLRLGFDINHPGYTSSYINIEGCKIWNIGRIVDTGNNGRGAIYIGEDNHHINIDRNLMYNIGRIGPDGYNMVKDHAIYTATVSSLAHAGHHNMITNNIIFNCSGNALNIGSTYDMIVNNVMAWSNENSRGGSNFITTEGAGGQNLIIANNVFYQPPKSNPYALLNYGSNSTWIVGNNIVYGGRMWAYTRAENALAMKGGNFGLTDCEFGHVDPLFVSAVRGDVSNYDFRLQDHSPAIDKGANLGISTDYLKNKRSGPPDIGASEYLPPATTYYNTAISATAKKNNCELGYTGSTETYTVVASKYSSEVSQEDADAKAAADLNANKQAYANGYGTCTLATLTTYFNTQLTATAIKNDCGPAYAGSTETFTVAANKYSSTISQEDANGKATEELNFYKQLYANTYGTCTLKQEIIYYNSKLTAAVTKNDCGTGYTGSSVTYTVAANKYSSAISQDDADNKAVEDLNANKQAYANANGLCTPKVTYWWWKR